jgi:Flp pilus assembly pilin Flp
MPRIITLCHQLRADRAGVTALEYGLVASALLGVVMVGFGVLATALDGVFSLAAATL